MALPKQALNFDGQFLEKLIPGYQTLLVEGRELYETENNYVQLGIRDGESHVYNRIPARKIKVHYLLKTNGKEDFRDKFNRLNVALYTEKEVEVWFNDEPEMYFRGSKSTVEQPEMTDYYATGTYNIYCGDPYKYTRSDATSVTWGSTTITFDANYLMGNTGSGAVDLPIIIEGGAFWGSTMITFGNQSYLMGDEGQEIKPIELYPTVEGLKVKPVITLTGSGEEVWIKTRDDMINLGTFKNSTIRIDTKDFYIEKNSKPMIRPMNDFYLYPNEPLYVQAKSSDFRITIEYQNRYL